jgi:RNA polymerase sigma factor (sigma-70 family)
MSANAPVPFQRFLDAHRDEVWRFLVASVGANDAEDCFQETFIAALRAYPRLHAGSNLRAWVLTIAHRKALDAHRGRARRALPVAEIAALERPAGARGSASPSARGLALDPTRSPAGGSPAAVERDGELWQAVRDLPPRQRSAVALRFLADLPHRDIASAIGCSEEAARRSLHEGLAKLRREVAA